VVVGFGSFGVGSEASEALEGGFDTTELEFKLEGAFLKRGYGSEAGKASLEIG
jgi:hypothetical protein